MEEHPVNPSLAATKPDSASGERFEKPERIVFTGYMGAGKSTIGRLLARALGFTLLDTDHLLAHKYQMPVNKMFENHGEEFFRQAEQEMLLELLTQPQRVISTGGGTLIREETLNPVIEAPATVLIYLRAPIATLYERVIFSHKIRPLMNVPNCEALFYERFNARQAFYEKAHITVDTDRQRPDTLLTELIEKLAAYYPGWDHKAQLALGKQLEQKRLAELEAQRRLSLETQQQSASKPGPITGRPASFRPAMPTQPYPDKPRFNEHGGREQWHM